jgi:hypothetical protein
MWNAIVTVPQQVTIIPGTTMVIRKKDKIGLVNVPVSHCKDTCQLVFDTGANLSVISESNAKKLGMKVYPIKLSLSSGIYR